MKLFIPGPVEVRPEILGEMARPPVGHRFPQFEELYADVISKLKRVLYTEQEVFTATCSATGLWEAAVRNCVKKRMLAATCGAFSERWADVGEANGKEVVRLSVEWGRPNLPDAIDDALKKGDYDAFTVVHNATSAGLTNPLPEIAEVLNNYPDVLFMVDAVSSMAGIKIEFDKLGIDFCLAGTQKAFALPPGFAIAAVSEKAMTRAKEVQNRGYYFDLLKWKKYALKNQTLYTPSISHLYALDKQLDDILVEGLENRFQRHAETARYVQRWALERFDIFPEEGYWSNTLTTIKNTRGISIAELNETLLEKHDCVISNGYGKLKEQTFRISHMGDLQLSDLEELLGWIDEIIAART